MLVFLTFLGVALLIPNSSAFFCESEETIENKKDFEFKIPHPPADKTYWRNYHLFYYLFGEFTGDPSTDSITAQYEDTEGNLIFQATISCKSQKWATYNVKDGKRQLWKDGKLEKPCQKGIFDLILKVEQPFMLKFMFNGEALEYNPLIGKLERMRQEKIELDESAIYAGLFKASATGTGVFTRLAFGKCIAWPRSIKSCPAVNEWLNVRSKMNATASEGAGTFGVYNAQFKVSCLRDSNYFMWVMQGIHPDRHSPESYCCCTNMETGRLYNKDTHCQSMATDVCKLPCTETYNAKIAEKILQPGEMLKLGEYS